MKRTLLLLTIAIVALCSCNRSLEVATSSQGAMFKVSAEPFYGESDASATKSAYFNESDSHKITDFNVWVYDFSTGELVNGVGQYKTYFTDPREVNGYYLFPDFSKKYEIYMLANLGKQDAPLTRADAEAYRYKFSDYDTFKTKGFPMAAHYCFVPSDPSTSHDLQLMRLVSRFNIQFKFGENNNYDFVLKEAVVRNSAKAVSPFAKESKANDAGDVSLLADKLSVSELSANGGVVYMIENIQGDKVFKDPVKRTADNITNEKLKHCTTYLEFSGELNRKDGTGYRTVRCRYYFGEGTFAGVRRNYNTPIVLTMTNTFTNNDNWTVEPMDPYNVAVVKFNDITPFTPQNIQNIETVNSISINRSNDRYRMYGRAFVDGAFADNVRYKYVFDEQALKNAGVTVKIFYPKDGGQKAFGEYGKGWSIVLFQTGKLGEEAFNVEFSAIDEHGTNLGKFTAKIERTKVSSISISESDKIIYYEIPDDERLGLEGEKVWIKLKVLPVEHESDIVISNITNGDRADFAVDNDKDELVITPRKLGKVGLTLSADGRSYDFTFIVKQKVNIWLRNPDYYFKVSCEDWPMSPVELLVSGTLGGSVQICTGKNSNGYDKYETIEDSKHFFKYVTITSAGDNFGSPVNDEISNAISELEFTDYPSWEMTGALDTYSWVNFKIYATWFHLHCEASSPEIDGVQCIEPIIHYVFRGKGNTEYYDYDKFEYLSWGSGFGGDRGRANLTFVEY